MEKITRKIFKFEYFQYYLKFQHPGELGQLVDNHLNNNQESNWLSNEDNVILYNYLNFNIKILKIKRLMLNI